MNKKLKAFITGFLLLPTVFAVAGILPSKFYLISHYPTSTTVIVGIPLLCCLSGFIFMATEE